MSAKPYKQDVRKAKPSAKSRPPRVKKPRKRVVLKQDRMPSAVRNTIRRHEIHARRREILAEEREKEAAQVAVRMAAGARKRKDLRRLKEKLYGKYTDMYVGGVRGHPPTGSQLAVARAGMATMKHASDLGRLFRDETVIIMGNSPTVDMIPPKVYRKFPTVGCNRAMRYNKFIPNVLVIGDREPYCQERDAGRLEKAAKNGVKLVLSDSIFDPSVLLRGPYSDINRRAQPCPDFKAYLYRIGPRKKDWDYKDVARGLVKLPVNLTTFEAPVVSCQNVVGSMLQAAAILGAKRIICIGIELKWQSRERSHFFGCGESVGAYEQDGSIDLIIAALKFVKKKAKAEGVEIINVSPYKNVPFAKVFGNYNLDKFLVEAEKRENWRQEVGDDDSEVEARQDEAVPVVLSEEPVDESSEQDDEAAL